MKQNEFNLINWFDELGKTRSGLPYEITKIFSEDEKGILDNSVLFSFEHVERVLSFSNLLTTDLENEEEFWTEIKVLSDDSSYYACMAMPLIRQLVQANKGMGNRENNKLYQQDEFDVNVYKKINNIELLSDVNQSVAEEAFYLANRMAVLKERYLLLLSANELVAWAIDFLESSALLILFAVRISKSTI